MIVREGSCGWKRPARDVPAAIVPGSVLDLTDVFDAPLSRVSIKDGRFVDEKGRPVRFFSDAEVFFRRTFGFKGRPAEFDTDEHIEAFMCELKRRGFNMIRCHYTDASLMRNSNQDFTPEPKALDSFFRVIAAMNRHGIYLNLDIAASPLGWHSGYHWASDYPPSQKLTGKREIYFRPESQEAWRRGCETLFGLRNPHTGRCLRDEPCLALAVAYNEQEFGFRPGKKGFADCQAPYRVWLRKRYSTIGELNAVRGTSYASFEDIPDFTPADVGWGPATKVGLDVYGFMDDTQLSLTEKYMGWFHSHAPGKFISNWNMARDLRQMSLRKFCDYVSINGYHAHPFAPDRNRMKDVTSGKKPLKYQECRSCIEMSAELARSFASCRIQGKPLVVTEYDIGWWSRFRYELGFVMGGYAALQGWDGLTPFSENVAVSSVRAPLHTFEHWRDPVAQAENFVTALAFRRGDVSESRLGIRWQMNRAEVLASPLQMRSISKAQSEMALIGSVSLAVDEPAARDAFALPAATGASVIFKMDGFQSAAEGQSQGEADAAQAIVAKLRAGGHLPAENGTDAARRIFVSSTGELRLVATNRFMQIDTPRLQGVCGEAGCTARLNDVVIRRLSRRGNLFVAARDGLKSIREAKRIVVGYVTDAQNSGLALASEKCDLVDDYGDVPVLYATGAFSVSVCSDSARSLKGWAVGPDGARLAKVPIVRRGSEVELSVDTARLECGPVFFFELAVE